MAKRSNEEQVVHDFILKQVKGYLSEKYKGIHLNPSEEKNKDVGGFYPDIVVESHGHVVEIYEVETESTVDDEEAKEWAEFSKLPVKVTVLVPSSHLKKARELAWEMKIASKIKVASYEVVIKG